MTSDLPETFEFVVPTEDAGMRIDVFLARRVPDFSRSQVQRLIRSGLVKLGSRAASKAGETVAAGETVSVRAERQEIRATAEALPLEIVYEDSDLVVVNKAAGMVVHVGAGVKSGTLVNALLHHIGKLSTAGGELRPGIVHRLDRMTSGLVIVAKNDFAHRSLATQFKGREVQKTYTLLVHGRVAKDSGEISRPVGRDPVRRTRMKAGGIAPREALTRFHVVQRFPHYTLLTAEPRTGRTHQLRVHFSSIGHPIVGDTIYGAPGKLKRGGWEEKTLGRNFLHASEIEFRHPRTGQAVRVEAPLPPELETILKTVATEDG